jgi:hypothetical protein
MEQNSSETNITPIFVPLRYRWRMFRMRFLPTIGFVATVVATAYYWELETGTIPVEFFGEHLAAAILSIGEKLSITVL